MNFFRARPYYVINETCVYDDKFLYVYQTPSRGVLNEEVEKILQF